MQSVEVQVKVTIKHSENFFSLRKRTNLKNSCDKAKKQFLGHRIILTYLNNVMYQESDVPYLNPCHVTLKSENV